jgi:hypothetical protein
MIRTIVKLIILAVIVNAAIHVVPVFWTNFLFKDAVAELARFSTKLDDKKIVEEVMGIAARMEVPLEPDNLVVTRQGKRVIIETRYHVEMEYFPRQFYPWDFTVRVVGAPGRFDEVTP